MKKNNPKISVLIPVYNGEKYLANTINSVINQTYDNWELIILDDESTDNSKKIIEEYVSKNNKIKSFSKLNDGNSNVALNMSIMYNYADGEYGFYMSQDDTIDSNCLQILMERALELDADVVIPNMLLKYGNDKFDKWNCSYPPNNDYNQILNGKEAFYLVIDFSINGFALIRMNLLKDKRCDTRYYDSDEYNTRMQYLWANKVAFADTNFYYYQGNPEAITHKFSIRRFQRFNTGVMLYNSYTKVFNDKKHIEKLMGQLMRIYIDSTVLLYLNIDKLNNCQIQEVKTLFKNFENTISFSNYKLSSLKVLKIYYEFIFAIIFFLLGSTMYTVKLYTCMRKIRNLLIKNKQN